MPDKQITGMRGVYLVAAKLSERGFIVSPTSRGAQGADLLVTDKRCQRVFTVQVKTDTTNNSFWLVGKKVDDTVAKTHVYVFVRIRNEDVQYYIVPSRKVSKLVYGDENWRSIRENEIRKHRNRWRVFGDP